MGDLTDAGPIVFDFGTADRLAAQFRATAGLLRAQVSQRNGLADGARTEWRGAYEVKFGEHMKICATDAERLAAAMETAAGQVEELARSAREEQHRRDVATEWKKRHDEWKRQQDSKGTFDHVVDFFAGDGEPKPPDLSVGTPPKLPVATPGIGSR